MIREKGYIERIIENFDTTLFCPDETNLSGIKMLHQSNLQEKSKNINMAFLHDNVKIILSVLIKEGLSRVKNNTV